MKFLLAEVVVTGDIVYILNNILILKIISRGQCNITNAYLLKITSKTGELKCVNLI